MTLTQLSHAAAEGRFLPFLADWTHAMAAALWVGGLLGFVVALFSGPLGALAADRRAKLRERSVRRFSKVATAAVLVLASTGLYAILLHVPSPQALVATPYGRALLVKLGLLTFVLAIGSANFLLRGRGPFGHLVVVELLLALGLFVATGFLTSLPPANAVSQEAPAPPQTALEPTTPTGASGSVSGEERAAENEADCRLVTYVAQENISEQEASVFSERLADMIREMEDPSLSADSVRNAALDHFGVPRYAECK